MTRSKSLCYLVQEARENLDDIKERPDECHWSHELSDYSGDELTLIAREAAKMGMCLIVRYRNETRSAYFQFVEKDK